MPGHQFNTCTPDRPARTPDSLASKLVFDDLNNYCI